MLRRLWRDEEPVVLTRKVFDLLLAFVVTVPGQGDRFVADVRVHRAEETVRPRPASASSSIVVV